MEAKNTCPWSSDQPPTEFDVLHCSSETREGCSDLYCHAWADSEPARGKSTGSRSFAMDARIRLDNLKSGCNAPLPWCSMDGSMFTYNYQRETQEPQDKASVLDLVELLEVEDKVEDEESWLYEFPKKQESSEAESALSWCRHVLDNPSPQMEAACRLLTNKLDQRSSSYRSPAVIHQTNKPFGDSAAVEKTDGFGDYELNIPHESISSSYRLQDLTDVHIMARIQEDSLRQDISAPNQSPQSQTCQSFKLARLQQQVAQFKRLKLAQNQVTSPGQTRSPLQTSLRSLQAVRNSRSLESDDLLPADQTASPPTGGGWSPRSAAPSSGAPPTARDASAQVMAVKRLHRSQSLSPGRFTQCAKSYLSAHGRVFASPERSTNVAWGRNVPAARR